MVDTLLAKVLLMCARRFHQEAVASCADVREILARQTAFAHHPVGGQDSLSIRLIVGAHRGR